jgi:antitoxin (DNA-binding transcriptional repressor) of toxin-antitoxin stability system
MRLWGQDLVSLSPDAHRISIRHGGAHLITDHGRQHARIAFEKVGHRGPAQKNRLSRLVVSDDLDMGGVLNSMSIEDAAVETLRAGSDLFLVCQKEDHVWRAYEAVFKHAEHDKAFANLVALKAKRVTDFKTKSAELRARMSPSPSQGKVDVLRRRVWEFTEELRANCIIVPEDRAL